MQSVLSQQSLSSQRTTLSQLVDTNSFRTGTHFPASTKEFYSDWTFPNIISCTGPGKQMVGIKTRVWSFALEYNLPHIDSSLPSMQSLSPSQRKLLGMQRLLSAHWWAQPSMCLAQSSSSERSWQWGIPSHTRSFSMHFFPWWHWNWSAAETESFKILTATDRDNR